MALLTMLAKVAADWDRLHLQRAEPGWVLVLGERISLLPGEFTKMHMNVLQFVDRKCPTRWWN
jgi:hypothetical protein